MAARSLLALHGRMQMEFRPRKPAWLHANVISAEKSCMS